MTHGATPKFSNPGWKPSDAEELALIDAMARRVAWAKGMAEQGVQVYKLDLSPEESQRRADAWFRAKHQEHDVSHQR